MQHIIGIALLVLGGLFALLGIALRRGSRRAHHAAESPTRMLINITGQSYIDLGGTLVNTPPLQTPLTHHPCTGWRVSLEQEDTSGDTTTWPEIWSKSLFGDFEIQYDSTLTTRPLTPIGGIEKIAAETIQIDEKVPLLVGRLQQVDLTPETIARLTAIGLPTAQAEQVSRYTKTYRVTETHLTKGDYVRGYQQTTRLDPHAPFTLIPFSQEAIQGFGCGFLGLFAFGFAVIAAVLGLVQLL